MALAIFGSSVVSREGMKDFVKSRNANAPLEVIDAYYDLESQWHGIRADVLISQMCIETGYLTSWWSQPPRRNMAGIGVTGEESGSNPNSNAWASKSENGRWYKGYSFADWRAAVQAHYGHMSAYCFADEVNNASQVDPRYPAAKQYLKSKGYAPAQMLTDLNGKWAVPGTSYGQDIEKVWSAAVQRSGAVVGQAQSASLAAAPASSSPTSSQWAEGVDGVIYSEFGPGTVNNPGSYVRARPNLDSNIGRVLKKLDRGALLHFIGYTDSGPQVNGGGTRWYLIADADGGGWIYGKLIN